MCCNTSMGAHATGLRIEATRDAALIADVHFRTVSVAYQTFFPPDSPAPRAPDLTLLWEERLKDSTATAFAASVDGEVVGTVAVRKDPDFDSESQLLGLHVLPGSWGRGFGGALHDRAVEVLTTHPYGVAGLWVIAANIRARSMYKKRGWELVPGVELDYLGINEVRYARTV